MGLTYDKNDKAKTERRDKFGILADCELLPDQASRTVKIVIDNPLPDDDRIEITTSIEKVIGIVGEKVAGTLIGSLGGKVHFFDGK